MNSKKTTDSTPKEPFMDQEKSQTKPLHDSEQKPGKTDKKRKDNSKSKSKPKVDESNTDEQSDDINKNDPKNEENADIQRLTDSCLQLDSQIKKLQKRNYFYLLFPLVLLIRILWISVDHHLKEMFILRM